MIEGARARKGVAWTIAVAAFVVTACEDGRVRNVRDAGDDAGGDPTVDAGHDAGFEPPPTFRNPVGLPDDELARQALRLMGAPQAGGSGSCTECHAVTRQNVRHFWDLTDAAWRTCFADLEVRTREAAQAIVECFQEPGGGYTTSKLGVFATGADFEWFRFVFRRAFGEGWEDEYERFRMRVAQSPDTHTPFTQEEFDLITEWFLRGTPWIENLLPHLDGPGECTPYVDASVVALVEESEQSGWSARNVEAGLLMHDCAGASSPLECLSSYPRVTEMSFGASWETPGTEQRLLFTVPYSTSYWTKCSADGRFVAHGGNGAGAGASVIDLERQVVIGARAAYDPGFFPDNSGFVFQGTSRGPAVCMQNVLLSGSPTLIDFNEPGCSTARDVGLYEHVGASLDGGDYWAVNSLWSGDLGNSSNDPSINVGPDATLTLRRLVNTGSGFEPGESFRLDAPWQGSAVVSPTMRFVVTQLGTAWGDPLGYVLHRIDMTRDAGGAPFVVRLTEVARYCYPGGKAAFSLDDRWIVTHHRATDDDAVDLGFTGPTAPAFAPYRGVSNIYLIDVTTGERHRVTNMQPGQRALFPSFRSDGWIYFLVRNGPAGTTPEYIVASNAGIVLR